MKKIFLNLFLMVSVVAITACGGDDDNTDNGGNGNGTSAGTLTVDIDGVTTTFNTFTANTYSSSGEQATEITASIDNGVSKIIQFTAYGTGANAIYFIRYKEGVNTYDSDSFSANVTEHTAHKLVGTFTGVFKRYSNNNTDVRNLTNGSFSYTF